MNWLAEELGVEVQEDWYKFSTDDVRKKCGRGMLSNYRTSFMRAVSSLYPEFDWEIWRFQRVRWVDSSHHRKYFDWVAEDFGVEMAEDWYKISLSDILHRDGAGIINIYGNSHSKALKNIYPEFDWEEWRFKNTPRHFWSKLENQRRFFDYVAVQLGIETQEEWYNYVRRNIVVHGGWQLIDLNDDSIITALATAYSEFHWLEWKFPNVHFGYWDK
jgi:hypothetical protein